MTLVWARLQSGNYAAFGEGGWFYLTGRIDGTDRYGRGRWFLEGGPADDPRTTDESYGYRTRGDAYREAEEQEEVAGLLTGRYRLDRQAAAEAMAQARKTGAPVELFVGDGQTLRLGTDAGGYTIDVVDAKPWPSSQSWGGSDVLSLQIPERGARS